MADLNRIRERLSVLRQEAQKLREQRQSPFPGPPTEPPQPAEAERRRRVQLEVELDTVEAQRGEAARQNAALADERTRLEASRVELEQARLNLERSLADTQLEAEQARAGRDRAEAELQATRTELEQARAELEAARARERESTAENAGSQRRSKKLRAEKRIAELEGQLETERELRQDFELALQLLQDQQREDAGAASQGHDDDRTEETAPATAGPARDPGPVMPGPEPDGWGVPLEAFPVDAEPPADAAKSSGRGTRSGRRARLLPRGRAER